MERLTIYLATVAFFVLGVFVFLVCCQYRLWRRDEDDWGKHTVALFLGRAALTLASPFLTAALTYATLSASHFKTSPLRTRRVQTKAAGGVIRRRASMQQRRTLVTTLLSFLGAAVFLVTPVGFTPAFLAAGFLLIVGAVSTC